MTTKTPRPNGTAATMRRSSPNDDGGDEQKQIWQTISLSSPPPSWTPSPSSSVPPPAVKLREEDDELSPTSVLASPSSGFVSPSAKHFSFASPVATKRTTPNRGGGIFTPKATYYQTPQQHGFLSVEKPRGNKRTKLITVIATVLLSTLGTLAWQNLKRQSELPLPVIPPPGSPSALAQEAFAKLYSRDWGATPSLWIVLEASFDKVKTRAKQDEREGDESHSFTDDTSMIYLEGKMYYFGLTEYLNQKYGKEETAPVRTTSYYSLQDHGLDYMARTMVTPDGSKTMIQIQYLPDELGGSMGVEELKQTILNYGKESPSSLLDMHYTGAQWRVPSSKDATLATLGMMSFLVTIGGIVGSYIWGQDHPNMLWAMLATASMTTTLSLSSIVQYWTISVFAVQSTPPALSTMTMACLILSIYYSKIQVDSYRQYKALGKSVILQSGAILLVMFSSFYVLLPSPTLQSIGYAQVWTVASSMLFHIGVVPHLWDYTPYAKAERNRVCPSPMTKIKSQRMSLDNSSNRKNFYWTLFLLCLFAPIAYQSKRAFSFKSLDTFIPKELLEQGMSMGHGRMTPFRIVFDGGKSKISMTSLNGYDIVQLVVDELIGIAIPNDSIDGNEDELSPEDESSLQGSTHVGEAYAEVQHLIKDFVDRLAQFKERQQEEFDHHHRRRQKQWGLIDEREEGSLFEHGASNYKANSGISATSYTGLSVLENSRIPQALYSAADVCRSMEPRCPSEALHLINYLEDETTTSDQMATYVTVNLGTDPFSSKGAEWLRLARETTQRLQEDPRVLGGVEVHIDGIAARMQDFHTSQNETMPRMLLFAFMSIFVASVVLLRSITAALRVVLTTVVSMAVAAGIGVFVYKDDVLNWVSLGMLSSASRMAGDADLSFAIPACMVLPVFLLVSDTLWLYRPRSQSEETLTAAAKATMCTIILMRVCFFSNDSKPSMLMVGTALAVDLLFFRRLLLPAVAALVPRSSGGNLSAKSSSQELLVGGSRGSLNNNDYLKKYEEFVRSPRAP